MFNIKNTILNLAVLAAALCPSGAYAQIVGTASPEILSGSTVYYTGTPGMWQNDEWNNKENIARDAAGNVYLVGTYSNSGDNDIFIRKIDPNGNQLWLNTIVNSGPDYGRAAYLSPDGNYVYVLGMKGSSIWVAKYNVADGTPATADTAYNIGGGSANAYDIAADASNVYVVGTSNSDIAILKIAAADLSLVNTVYHDGGTGYNYYDAANAVAMIPGGGLAVGGYIGDTTYGNEIWVAKYNTATLAQVWASTYVPVVNHPQWGDDQVRAVKADASGNIYAVGFYQSENSGQDIWLGKYDSNGNLMYAKTKNGPSNGYDKGFGVGLDPFGNVYVTGKVEAYNLGQGDNIWLGKYSQAGALVSELSINKNYEIGFDVEVSSWMIVVAGAFQNDLGLVNVYPEQFGPVQQLFAGPGFNTASVNLSWVYEQASANSKYQIRMTTDPAAANPAFPWASVTPTLSPVSAVSEGQQETVTLNGLPTRMDNTQAAGGPSMAGPVYYFKVSLSVDNGTTWTPLSNVANAAPNAPYNYVMDTMRGQDRFWVFNNSYGLTSAFARDAATGNIYVAYGNNMGGLAITKLDQYNMPLWTSFYNDSQYNGRYNPQSIKLDPAGNIYVAGAVNFDGTPGKAVLTGNDAWIAKFNPLGLKVWDQTVEGPGSAHDIFNSVVFDSTGKVYAGGEVNDGAGGSEMLIVKYAPLPVGQQWISSYTYKGTTPSGSPASIWGLAADNLDNIFAGGYFSGAVSGTAFDRDAAIVKFNPFLAKTGEHVYVNAQNAGVDGWDVVSDLVFSAGSLYAAGSRNAAAASPYPDFWAAQINPADWSQPWTNTYASASGLEAGAYGIRLNAGSLYVSGFEKRSSANGSQDNIVLRKLDLSGVPQWTKIVDGTREEDSAKAYGLEVGGDGYFYLNAMFNIMPGGANGDMGMPGVAKIAEPLVGIGAMTGYKPCSVQLSWVTDADLPSGTTFYVHYATYTGVDFNAAAAQYSFVTDYPMFSGSFVNHLVPGLEAGNGAPASGQSNIDSPRYYFKIGYKKPLDASATAVAGSTSAVANTPGAWDRMDRYPNGLLYVVNNVHSERNPLLRDAAGNIYTAGTFNAWGWNSNTAYVRKFTPAGQPVWTRYYSDEYDNSSPVINALALDAAGNLYAAGAAGSNAQRNYYPYGPESATGKDMLLIKYSPSGRMLWAKTYNYETPDGGDDDAVLGVAVNDAAVYAAGYVKSVYDSNQEAFIARINPADGVVVSSVATGAVGSYFSAVKLDEAGNAYVVGAADGGATGMDLQIVKADASLTPQASLNIAANGEDEAYALAIDTYTTPGTAILYVAGKMMVDGQEDATLNKFTASGASIAGAWLSTVTYNSANANSDEATGVALDGLGGVYLSGTEYRYDLNQGKNIFVRKYNELGDLMWSQTLNSAGNNEDASGGVAADTAGNVYAAIDAAQMGAAAGGYTAPGTYYPGTTANTANLINGAGYFRHTQFNMITTNPKLTVRVNRLPNQGLSGVAVAVMSFNQTGGMDPNGVNFGVTNASGAVTMSLPSGKTYFVAISSHAMVPTISEQISDPGGNFFVDLNADATRQYYISYRPATADPVRVMTIHATGLTTNDYVMGEVYINNTGEKVAYSIIRATGTNSTMEIYNLGAAANGVYGMAVSVPARNKVLPLFMNGDFPALSYYEADMNNAMGMATGFDVGGSTNPPSVTGMISDANFSPLEGARVQLQRYSCTGVPPNSVCTTAYSKENLTDVSGRFSFYDVPFVACTGTVWPDGRCSVDSQNYQLNVGKAGYESNGRTFVLTPPVPPAMPAPQFYDFQLAPATYTLTGVLKYNGMPLPNAHINVGGDQNSYSQGVDSYRQCQYGGCGVRSQGNVLTGADGSFTLTGLTDGNASINAAFQGGWRQLSPTDKLRVTISSQGATGPNVPANNFCRPGKVWVVNSSGACVTAGSVVFNIVPENSNSGGLMYGNVTFVTTYTITETAPLVISTSAPLTLMAQQSCNNGCQGSQQMGFTSLAGTFITNTTSYSIVLSTGFKYYPKVFSPAWAQSSKFDSEVELTEEAPTVRQDMSVVRAGGLHGVLKFPDGSTFKQSCSMGGCTYSAEIDVSGVNVDVGEGGMVDENGEFNFPNIAPGVYRVSIRPRGSGFVWVPPVLESVTVAEGKTTEVKLQLENGLAVKPQIFGLPEISTAAWGYIIIGVNSGEEMNQKRVTELFFSDPKYSFNYSTSTGWETKYMPAGQYDFYLLMGSKYDPGGGDSGNISYNQFANFIGRVKGMSVQKSDTNPNVGTASQPIAINILGAIGQSSIAGTVQGSKMFLQADLERMFGNFAETFNIIPAVMLYDTAGDLRGFSNGMPGENSFAGFMSGMQNRDMAAMQAYLAANPLDYGIWGLPPGRYTAVFANPNYPPMAKEVTLPDNSSYIFNFDDQQVVTGGISGVVKSSATGVALGGARVYLKHRTVEKFTLTDSSGAFSFSNLPAGIYRLEVSRNGYVTVGRKTGLSGSDSVNFSNGDSLYMLPSESTIAGRLFMSKFPTTVTRAGVQIVAYDETLNVESPEAYLPKTEVQTDASGNYEITGVIPGHVYKLSAFYQGKLPEVMEVTAQEGNTIISDITLKDIPPQITIKVKKSADSVSKVDVQIKSPKQLISIPSCQYNPGQAFSEASAVTLALVPGPNNTYLGQFTVTSSQQYYTVKVTAGDGSNKMVKEFVYDQVSNAKTEQYIQQESLAGGEVQMDKETEEYSGIELDPGALSYSTATSGTVDYSNLVGGFFSALPSVRTVKTAKGNLSITAAMQSLMASEIYNMDLSNASANKPFTLTLKYDKERGAGSSQRLRIYQQDADGNWKEVPGSYTVDPMLGVLSVDIASLSNAYEGTGGVTTPLGRKRYGMSAVVNGRYRPAAAGTSQSGRFAVFTANPPTGVPAYSAAFEVVNMPNPFNLKSKSVALSADIGTSGITNPYPTSGTVIKYNLPAGKSGNLKFVIYNLAGEKVRTIDEGSRTGNQVLYSEWDGKNDNNQDCASGVYFMLTYLDGKKLGNKAHKMAIIK